MHTPEIESAWRFSRLNWALGGAMAAALAASLALTDFSLALPGIAVAAGYIAVYGGFAYANAHAPKRRDPQVMFILAPLAQLVLFAAAMTPLTYVATTINVPVQDANLLALDRALGLDFAAFARYVDDRPLLAIWLGVGYNMIRWQITAVPIVLAAIGRFRRTEEFVFAFGLALVVTTIISGLVPAIGAYQEIGLDPATLKHLDPGGYFQQLHDLPPTRDGTLRHLDLLGLAGIVTFPSFHAASAVLYAWAMWPSRLFRPIALIANGAMLVATPVVGGHYFVDVFAGVAVAVLAIVAARRVGNMIAERRADAVAVVPAAPVAAAAALAPAE
jgi:hypothetical protein